MIIMKDTDEKRDTDIIFSKSIKAGKRIYYLDVKKNRKEELFLAITESKKIFSGDEASPVVQFEKHKIFLYKEDFDKFLNGLSESIGYIKKNQKEELPEQKEQPDEIPVAVEIEMDDIL
ncbi:MAG: hypothetical protein DBY16_12850 [Coprobacter sp.]|jgi:hypothetical protein|nr:PUR family DNA/RNA-binding protein [Barnesiella sp. GGCC_0306]MBS7039558.1 PUR family DNA/RNA-binding protein [Bacteroidales bacterium]PWM88455.1 MAG: hypothetical protein DBY16_12850 [Coprobacter sp.]